VKTLVDEERNRV